MNNNLSETLRINRLLDIYGNLLTQSQLEIMKDYYELNLSLSEISEVRNISRTAVSDALKQAKEKLDKFDKKIGICKVFDDIRSQNNPEKTKVIDEIEEKLKNGI